MGRRSTAYVALKEFVVGTPLEPLARYSHYLLTGNKDYAYNRETLQIMRKLLKPDSCFVDVGCNEGLFLGKAIGLSPQGKHWGFEPIPHLFASLQVRYQRAATLINAVLSDKNCDIKFKVLPCYGRSGIELMADDVGEQFTEITVASMRMDDCVPSTSKVDFVKIDVNGAEYLVFQGAADTISRNRPFITFEHGLGGADRYGHKPDQVFDILSRCGMHLNTMARFLKQQPDFSSAQFCDRFHEGRDFQFCAY